MGCGSKRELSRGSRRPYETGRVATKRYLDEATQQRVLEWLRTLPERARVAGC
jgi:hypothetical protein